MKKFIINGKLVKVYDSIDELPIINYQKYNKFLLIDSGIGSDVDDIDKHIQKVAKLINSDKKLAIQELQNLRMNMYMVNSEISPKHLAFSALVHSINGKIVSDLSDDSLKSILSELNTIKHSWIVEFILKFKKKVEYELDTYFPKTFESTKEKEAYDKLKIRTNLVLESIIDEKDNAKSIETIDEFIFNLHKPKQFSGSNSVEVQYDKQFENACIVISQKTNMNAKSMSTLEFYNVLENLKKQSEEEQKSLKHGKKIK